MATDPGTIAMVQGFGFSMKIRGFAVSASISKIELYNSNRFVSFVYILYVILLYCYSLLSTICMKLDPGIHIGMHLVCFSKTRCDTWPLGHP
jgi:hypothetical protein